MDSDSLRSIRNSYYLGFYDEACKEAKQVESHSPPDVAQWASIYFYRSLCAWNPTELFKSLAASSNSSTSIEAIKQLATYRSASEENQDLALTTIQEWLQSDLTRHDVTLQLCAALILFDLRKYKECLKLVSGDSENLEKLAMSVAVYLQLDRVDLAAKQVKAMTDLDDDDTLTQLATCWYNIAVGGEKIQEATAALQELIEKFGPSVPVLNSLAVCELLNKNYTSAFSSLKQARELSISSGSKVSDLTLLNSIVALQQLRKNEVVGKIVAELKSNYPNHPWIKLQQELEQQFDKAATIYRYKQ